MKNNPNYVRSPKNHTLDQFYMNLIPYSHYAHSDPFYVNFWMSLIPPLDIQVPLPRGNNNLIPTCKLACKHLQTSIKVQK